MSGGEIERPKGKRVIERVCVSVCERVNGGTKRKKKRERSERQRRQRPETDKEIKLERLDTSGRNDKPWV